MTTKTQPMTFEERMTSKGWGIAQRLSDQSHILVSPEQTTVYIFRNSLIGTALQPIENIDA